MFSLCCPYFFSSFLEAETTTQLTQTSGGDEEITFPIQTCTRAGDVGWPSGWCHDLTYSRLAVYAVFVNINIPLYVIGRTICLCIYIYIIIIYIYTCIAGMLRCSWFLVRDLGKCYIHGGCCFLYRFWLLVSLGWDVETCWGSRSHRVQKARLNARRPAAVVPTDRQCTRWIPARNGPFPWTTCMPVKTQLQGATGNEMEWTFFWGGPGKEKVR